MSEDEAFIRKVVDSPGDDLPRLVYADWLDERDDPRGAYLRAEVEWAKSKQTTGFLVLRLHGLAEGLDPVWVARVSRPPEGVCCDHLKFRRGGPHLARKDVDEIDRWPGVKLPAVYKAFLLNHNGGYPIRRGSPEQKPELIDDSDSIRFFPVIPPGDPRARGTLHGEVQRHWDHVVPDWLEGLREEDVPDTSEWLHEVMPIGFLPKFRSILLGVKSLHYPRVYFDWGSRADEFTTFLAGLCADPEPPSS